MNRIIIVAVIVLATATAVSFDAATVTRAIDGDTIEVEINGQEEVVRLLGIDTPESVAPGKDVEPGALEASAFTKQLEGQKVILTYDEKRRGYYGRLLAYVWVEENGQLVCWNIALIRAGHSELYDKYSFDGIDWFREALE